MLEIKNVCGPSPQQWNLVIRGMRNPFKGQDGGDSFYCTVAQPTVLQSVCNDTKCDYYQGPSGDGVSTYCSFPEKSNDGFVMGKEDLKLSKNLSNAGPDHGKFLRELPVIIECRAPLYWWKQLDAYRVGVPAMNSESTMHTITKKPFELSDFRYSDGEVEHFLKIIINQLNRLRDDYFELDGYEKEFKNGDRNRFEVFMWDWFEEFVDETFIPISDEELMDRVSELKNETWMSIIQLLPESYYQTRTFITNYAGLRNMFGQRIVVPHKLPEWREMFQQLSLKLPYFTELIVGNQLDKLKEQK